MHQVINTKTITEEKCGQSMQQMLNGWNVNVSTRIRKFPVLKLAFVHVMPVLVRGPASSSTKEVSGGFQPGLSITKAKMRKQNPY